MNRLPVNLASTSYMASAHGRLLLGNHPSQRLKVAAMFNLHRLVECSCGGDILIKFNTSSTFSIFRETNQQLSLSPLIVRPTTIYRKLFHTIYH